MTNVELELPPPGPGFDTVTETVPGAARSEPGTFTTIDVGDCDATVSPVVPNMTVADARKFVPVIVNAMAGDPALTLEGESPVIAGAGLPVTTGGAGAVAVKLAALEAAPPGLVTPTVTPPAADGTVTNAVNVPAFTNV